MLDDTPTLFLVAVLFIGAVFVVLPVTLVRGLLVQRRRHREWLPATATVTRVRTETRGTDDSRRTVLVATYTYRDPAGATQQGEGDLGRQGLAVGNQEQTVEILVDPLDGSRSQVRDPASAGSMGCGLAVSLLFGAMGLLMVVLALTALVGA